MASEKQIAANRANAQKSTGPRTTEGKSRTRLNAKRDGITGQILTLSEEDRPIFEKLKSELIADLDPKTVMELKLASAIAWDTWRLDHLRAVEMNMYALGTDNPKNDIDCDDPELHTVMTAALTFADQSQVFARLSLYEQRLNRSVQKNLATLRDLQAERKLHYKKDRAQEVAIARYSDINGLTYEAPAAPTLNGSVFSTTEIKAAANRFTTRKVARKAIWNAPLTIQFAGSPDNKDPNRPNSGLKVAAAA